MIKELNSKLTPIKSTLTNGVRAIKAGNLVQLSFEYASAFTASANASILTLPTGLRPSDNVSFTDTLSQKRVVISTDGTVFSTSALSSTNLRGYVTYIVQ